MVVSQLICWSGNWDWVKSADIFFKIFDGLNKLNQPLHLQFYLFSYSDSQLLKKKTCKDVQFQSLNHFSVLVEKSELTHISELPEESGVVA